MNKTEVSYSKALSNIRKSRITGDNSEITFEIDKRSQYTLLFRDSYCYVNESNLEHFNRKILNRCNNYELPSNLTIRTHDYSSRASWANESVSKYIIKSNENKEFVIDEMYIKAAKTLSFSEGQYLKIAIFISIDDRVLENEIFYDDNSYNGDTGWLKVFPDEFDHQAMSEYIYYNKNEERIRVIEYKFTSLDDIKDIIPHKIVDKTYFFQEKINNIGLRNYNNERIEVSSGHDEQINSSIFSSDKTVVSFKVKNFDEL